MGCFVVMAKIWEGKGKKRENVLEIQNTTTGTMKA